MEIHIHDYSREIGRHSSFEYGKLVWYITLRCECGDEIREERRP